MPFRYISRVELRHLRYFVTVAELNNVSKAAEKLRVAQPALSRQIRDLEDELGAPLLERTSRGVILTEAGKIFAVEARDLLSRAEAAIKSARAVSRGESGELHLGYAPSPTAELLPRTLHAFQNAAPGVRVVLHDFSSEENLRELRNGNLHAALIVQPCAEELRGLAFEPLISYPICVAMAPRHRLARPPVVKVEELLNEKLVVYSRGEYGEYHELLKRVFSSLKRMPQIAQECDSGSSLVAAVESLNGVAIVPNVIRCLTGGRLKIKPLRPDPEPVVVGVAFAKTKIAPFTRRLLQTLRALHGPSGEKPELLLSPFDQAVKK